MVQTKRRLGRDAKSGLVHELRLEAKPTWIRLKGAYAFPSHCRLSL